MSGYHRARRASGKQDHINREVERIEGEANDFWQFCWEAIGLPANRYPGDKPYWHFMRELHPDDQYRGEW